MINRNLELKAGSRGRLRVPTELEEELFKDKHKELMDVVEDIHEMFVDIGRSLLTTEVKDYAYKLGLKNADDVMSLLKAMNEKKLLFTNHSNHMLSLEGIHCIGVVINKMPLMVADKYIECICGKQHKVFKHRGKKNLVCKELNISESAKSWNIAALKFFTKCMLKILDQYNIEPNYPEVVKDDIEKEMERGKND